MRHLGTVFAAAVVGPLAWILLAVGQDRSTQTFASVQGGEAVDSHDFVRPALVLVAAGLLLGLIATLRFSPLGAVLAGTGYAASYLGLLMNPTRMVNLLDHKLTLGDHQINLAIPVQTGTTLLLGSLLLVGVLSIHRWRRWPGAEETPAFHPEFSMPRRRDLPVGADGLGSAARPDYPVTEPASATAGRPEWIDSLRKGPNDPAWQSEPWGSGRTR